MNKYEQLIEHIINENEQAARELFHQIVVEKSRDIYESLMDEEIGGNPAADFVNDITDDVESDEVHGLGEEEDLDDEMDADDDMDGDMDDGMDDDEDHHADVGGDDALEDRVMDLESELDELKAEFDRLMSDEAGDDMDNDDDMGMDMDVDADLGSDDDMDMDSGMDDEEDPMMEAKHKKQNKNDKHDMSQAEVMKEYVEKVKDLFKTETESGSLAGTGTGGDKAAVNKGSVVANKNDMGGTTSNIVKGGSESSPEGQKPTGKAGGFVKPAQEIDVAKRNVNKPGGNKGAQNFYNSKAKGKDAEGSTTHGSETVKKDSLLGK